MKKEELLVYRRQAREREKNKQTNELSEEDEQERENQESYVVQKISIIILTYTTTVRLF